MARLADWTALVIGIHASAARQGGRCALLAALVFCALPVPAMATPDSKAMALLSECRTGEERFSSQSLTVIFRVVGWTGSCAEGKRDGKGVLSVRHETIDHEPSSGNNSTGATWEDEEGTFVAGKPLGAWCVVKAGKEGGTHVPHNVGCLLRDGTPNMTFYTKAADGRWQVASLVFDIVKPGIFLEPDSLERESDRIISDARAGRPIGRAKLEASVPAFDDLLRDGKLRLALDKTPIDLGTKRVAVLVSTRAAKELERFAAMRQALIDVSSGAKKVDEDRNAFIAHSDPKLLLAGVSKGIRNYAPSAQPAADLSVLQDGTADYAIVFDWRFFGDFAISPKDYKLIPPCPENAKDTCRHLYRHAYGVYVLNRNLEVVRQFDLDVERWTDYFYSNRLPYAKLFEILSVKFEDVWNLDDGGVLRQTREWMKATTGAK